MISEPIIPPIACTRKARGCFGEAFARRLANPGAGHMGSAAGAFSGRKLGMFLEPTMGDTSQITAC